MFNGCTLDDCNLLSGDNFINFDDADFRRLSEFHFKVWLRN